LEAAKKGAYLGEVVVDRGEEEGGGGGMTLSIIDNISKSLISL